MERQAVLGSKVKKLLISFRNPGPVPFVEGSQICSPGSDMQPGLVREKRDFNKKICIIVKIPIFQAGNRDHGTIRCLVKTAKLIFFRFGGDQFHFLFKGNIPVYIHRDQTAFFLFNNGDFR